MARLKIIVLETNGNEISYAFWADVPAARQIFYADAGKASVWKDATAADNAALQNGSVVEKTDSIVFEPSAGAPRIRQELEALHNRFQNKITAHNPWNRYGTVFDGTAWTNGGVA